MFEEFDPEAPIPDDCPAGARKMLEQAKAAHKWMKEGNAAMKAISEMSNDKIEEILAELWAHLGDKTERYSDSFRLIRIFDENVRNLVTEFIEVEDKNRIHVPAMFAAASKTMASLGESFETAIQKAEEIVQKAPKEVKKRIRKLRGDD